MEQQKDQSPPAPATPTEFTNGEVEHANRPDDVSEQSEKGPDPEESPDQVNPVEGAVENVGGSEDGSQSLSNQRSPRDSEQLTNPTPSTNEETAQSERNAQLLAAAASAAEIEDEPDDDPELDTLPDQNTILEKLGQIRDSKRQVVDMLDSLKKENSSNMDKGMIAKLVGAYDGFKSQEEQYLGLLEKIMKIKEDYKQQKLQKRLAEQRRTEAEESIAEIEESQNTEEESEKKVETAEEETKKNEEKPVDEEMLALIKQRDLLRTMLAQQKEMRDRQHNQVAQMEERAAIAKTVANERTMAQQLVDAEADSIAKKRELLSALKEKLAIAQQVRDKAVAEEDAARNDPSGPSTSGVQDGVVREAVVDDDPRIRELHSAISSKEEESAALLGRSQSLKAKLDALRAKKSEVDGLMSDLDRVDGTAAADEPSDEDKKALDSAMSSVQQQMEDLALARRRLIELRDIAADVEQFGGGTLPPQVHQQLIQAVGNAAELVEEDPLTPTADEFSLAEERGRLDDIKNQLRKLKTRAGSNEIPHQAKHVLNNGAMSEYDGDEDEDDYVPASRHQQGLDSNPQMACFRRNNQLETPSTSQMSRSMSKHENPSRRPSSTNVGEQYGQLQAHIDSIREIFHNISMPLESPGNPHVPPPVPSDFMLQMLQQQQLLMSQMMSCQQQIQIQQMEQRNLQSLCANLQAQHVSNCHTPSGEESESNQRSIQPPALYQSFDGRPLSHQSLYNLLGPNPYLPYNPAYPPPEEPMRRTVARHPWAPSPASAATSWHPGAFGSDKNNLSPRGLVQSCVPAAFHPPGKPPPVPKLELNSSGMKQTNVMRAAARSFPKQPASLGASQEYLAQAAAQLNPHGGNLHSEEQFEEMREAIYSEVATLISQNEQRPDFLLELFKELQLLGSDRLKTRALEAIKDLLNRFLTDNESTTVQDDEESESPGPSTRRRQELYRRSNRDVGKYLTTTVVDQRSLLSDSGATSEDTARSRPPQTARKEPPPSSRDQHHDLSEAVASTSSLSTPEQTDAEDQLQHSRNLQAVSLNNSTTSSCRAVKNAKLTVIKNSSEEEGRCRLDVVSLEAEIRGIMEDVEPFLDQNQNNDCNDPFLKYLRKMLITLSAAKFFPSGESHGFFEEQLAKNIDESLQRYSGIRLDKCRARLLTDVSEVVFNEMAFYRLMQNIDSLAGPQRRGSADLPPRNQTLELDRRAVASARGPKSSTSPARKTYSQSPPKLAPCEVDDDSAEDDDQEPERTLSASLQAFKAPTPRLPSLQTDPELKTQMAKQLADDVDRHRVLGDEEEREPSAESYHTASTCEKHFEASFNGNGPRGASVELEEAVGEEIPELLDAPKSVFGSHLHTLDRQSSSGSGTKLNLSFEPHPENKEELNGEE